jgi:Dolichyl-phosphate-mannose-protein mannosyltransferase
MKFLAAFVLVNKMDVLSEKSHDTIENKFDQIKHWIFHHPNIVFYLFLLGHIIAWTVLPTIVRHTTTNDLIEAITWGRQFEWSYDKNPWLAGWLTYQLGVLNLSGVWIYFVQQLFIALGFWSIARLTTRISGDVRYGVVCALMFEATLIYTIDVQLNNDNYFLQGLLPLSALLFYYGIHTEKIIYWIGSSVILAIATCAKYSAVLWAILFGLFLLSRDYRRYYRTIKPYLSLLIFILILLPNFIWLKQHDFLTVSYAVHDRGLFNQASYWSHVINNVNVLLRILLEILPGLFILLTALDFNQIKKIVLTRSDQYYLSLLGLGSFIFPLFIGLFGISLNKEWLFPFFSFLGSFILLSMKWDISLRSFNRFIFLIGLISILMGSGYLFISERNGAGGYPGLEIARFATALWKDTTHTRLSYVAGNRYDVGHIVYYSKDHPQAWIDFDLKRAPWINPRELLCKGALFVIVEPDIRINKTELSGKKFPDFVLKQFPDLILKTKSFSWYRENKQPELKIHFGLLLPNQRYC